MIGEMLFAAAVALAEVPVADAGSEGLVFCQNNERAASVSIVAYGTTDEDESAVRQLHPDVGVARLEQLKSPLTLTDASDQSAASADGAVGLLIYDREVRRRDDGGTFGYMIASYSINPSAYQCAMVRPERTCFGSLRGLPIVTKCN